MSLLAQASSTPREDLQEELRLRQRVRSGEYMQHASHLTGRYMQNMSLEDYRLNLSGPSLYPLTSLSCYAFS